MTYKARSSLATVTALAAACLSAPALAGGVPADPALPPIVVQPELDWSGFYAGAQLEYGQGTVNRPPVPGLAVVPDLDVDGTGYGVFVGYRTDYGSTVFGVEFDFVAAQIAATGVPGEIDRIMRSTLEYGVDTGNALIYGTAGVFSARITPAGPFDDDDWGFVGGVGVDYRLSDSSFLAAELLYHRIDDFSNSGLDIDLTTFGVGIAFEF
jgi:opacity protein-like surface antigen